MKKCFFLFCSLLLTIHAVSGQNSCLVARYNFTGNALDSVGSNHGTVYNATLTNDRFGKPNSAYAFSSSASSYIQIPYANFFTPNYTYALWVKPASLPNTSNFFVLMSVGGLGGDQNMQLLNAANGGTLGTLTGLGLTAYQKSGSTISAGGVVSGSMPSTNTWYHFALTRDSNYYKVYINGCLVATSASSNGALPFYGNSTFDARIGCRERGGWYFDGVLDDVNIYSCALSAAEVSKLYNNLKPLVITKDTTICKDQFQAFKLKVPRTYCTYRWVDMASPNTILSMDSQLLVNITSTKTFRCITNSKDTAFATVRIIPRPKLNLGNDTFYCGKVLRTLDAGPKALSYKWDDNSTSRYRSIQDTGYFHVLYTDSFGCKARDTIRLRVHNLPVFDLGKDTHYCNTFNRTLTSVQNASKYTWSTNDSVRSITISNKGVFWAEALDSNGCKFRDSITIANPKLSAGFKLTNIDSCFKSNKVFVKDTSRSIENSKVRSVFHFGDNTIVTADSAIKNYGMHGAYSVKQVVYTDMNCKDSVTKIVSIWPNAKPGFAINDSLQCYRQQSFDYTNSSTISSGNLTYQWNLGDGTSSSAEDISSKVYAIDSSYNIKLFVTSDKFCRDTLVKSVTVFPNGKLSFSIDQAEQCFNGHAFNLSNSSTIKSGSLSTHIWHFSDGSIDTAVQVSLKRFLKPDTIAVELETISDKGCRDSLQKTIVIHSNTAIQFGVSKDTQCYKWNSFDFVNSSFLSKGNFSNKWSFGDGLTDTSKSINAKRFNAHGSYQVTLETTTDKGCKDTAFHQILVLPSPLDAFSIDKPKQCYRGNLFNFTNQSSIPSGVIVQRNWSMGDGNNYLTTHVQNYSYVSEDSFQVALSSTSDQGCKDTFISQAITFAQPIARFTIPNDSQCWQKHYFNIINNTKIKYGQMRHVWDFGDNSSDTSFTPITKKYANTSASYLVRYSVTSEHGCQDSANHQIHLLERPIAEFDINDSIQCFRSHHFTFGNQTTFSAMNTVSYFWNYGNGDTSLGYTPKSAVYSSPVYHNVRLIAYSYLTNCFDTTVYRVLPAPHAVPDFAVNKDSQCLKTNHFIFSNRSTISMGGMTYQWDFADGSADTSKNPNKTYVSGFSRQVKLVAISNHGCKDSISKPIIIIPHPVSRFTIDDSAQCLNRQSFNLTNTSSIQYGTYTSNWFFDDGESSVGDNFSNKTFAAAGYHTIRLALNSNQNCKDTFTRQVFLERDKNTVVLQTNPDSQCLKNNLFRLDVQSNNSEVNFTSYKWSFGDGNSSTQKSLTHRYGTFGTKNLLLETMSANGCHDTAYYTVRVHPQAVLDFEADSPCDPDSVRVTDKSLLAYGNIVAYNYEFSDGFISNLRQPSHKFAGPGTYGINLQTITDKGCKDTLNKPGSAIVRKKPTAGFTQERIPDKQFDVATIQFTNTSSQDASQFNWNFGNGNTSSEENPEADFNDTFRKTITLIVVSNEGCTDTFSQKTGSLVSDFVFYFPDAFSPGQDGVNDVLKPVMTPYVRKYVMEVFNRWGERVFYTDDLTKGWDGKYEGVDCEQGVYLCRIYLVPMRGAIRSLNLSVTLIR